METFIACHLLKAVEGWTDIGIGDFELFYLRDKKKREVDFLVVRDGEPWFRVEAKKCNEALSPNLAFFQKATGARLASRIGNAPCHAKPNVSDVKWKIAVAAT